MVVLIVSGDDTVREKLRFVVLPAESATWKETLVVPAVVGAPEMVPVVLSDSPDGRGLPRTLQVYGGTPPAAVRELVYPWPSWAGGSGPDVIESDVLLSTVRTRVADCAVGDVLSVAWTVIVKTPEPVQVPTM